MFDDEIFLEVLNPKMFLDIMKVCVSREKIVQPFKLRWSPMFSFRTVLGA